ncbi:mitochondrial 37S ribosomal protein mS42 [Magnusiomyces paraingens]|uniref:Manganese/iron superoxide dismutase C-terminal domain-containing protein n=1 Tax=Magnusiomyces paraingens TaxID=2606893 RepID=A0A5E8B6H4_9ASCO|nr:uncharacterized protein SAPINGB_P001541 [Saprochaete ingens]VVT47097.1 unnamed protein product [Saprochaete ingens]
MIRTHSVLRTTSAAASRLQAASSARRTYYAVPTLSNIDISHGIPGLYSAEQLDVAWTQTQKHAADQLKTRLAGVVDRSSGNPELQQQAEILAEQSLDDLVTLSKNTPDMDKAVSYYAGLIYNNEFFFRSLRSQSVVATTESDATTAADTSIVRAKRSDLYNHIDISSSVETNPIPLFEEDSKKTAPDGSLITSSYANLYGTANSMNNLQRVVIHSFGSVLAFKENFLAHAEAMFGDGYTWLVRSPSRNTLNILNTYGAGTPHIASFSSPPPPPSSSSLSSPSSPSSPYGGTKLPGNVVTQVVPLLCINSSQRAYLHDYGVFGKRTYLENLWNTIDWQIVNARFKESMTSYKSNMSHKNGKVLFEY